MYRGKGQNFQTKDVKKGSSGGQDDKIPGDMTKNEPMVIFCRFLELPAGMPLFCLYTASLG